MKKKFSIYIYIYVYICVIYSVGNQCEQTKNNKDHPWKTKLQCDFYKNLILKKKKTTQIWTHNLFSNSK